MLVRSSNQAVGWLLDRRDRQAELAGELEVALVAARHRHDRAGAVAHQDVVGDPDRDLLAVDRIGGVRTGEHAGLLAGLVLAFEVLLAGRPVSGSRRRRRPGRRSVRVSTKGCSGDSTMNDAPNSVSGRVVNTVMSPAARGEVDLGAVAASDPVALHRLDRVGPVEQFEVVDQAVGVGGDAHHPLAHVALEHREVAAVAASVGGDLLVGDHGAEAGAPVDRCLADVGEPVVVDDVGALDRALRSAHGRPSGVGRDAGLELGDQFGDRARPVEVVVVPGVEHLAEDPLGPAVEVGVGGRHAAARVVGEPEPAELAAIGGDVVVGRGRRVLAGLDGELLGGQPERVEAHRVQHVVAGHPLEAGEHVGADEAERVSDVQAGARRVREHVEHEQLLAACRGEVGIGEWARRCSASRTCGARPTSPASATRCPARGRRCSGAEVRRCCLRGMSFASLIPADQPTARAAPARSHSPMWSGADVRCRRLDRAERRYGHRPMSARSRSTDTVANGFGAVADAFEQNFVEHGELGAAFCAVRRR